MRSSYKGYEETSNENAVIIFISIIFVIGLLLLVTIKEYYMTGTIIYDLIGIFTVQQREICTKYKDYCSDTIQYLCIIFALSLGICLGISIYCLKHQDKSNGSIKSVN